MLQVKIWGDKKANHLYPLPMRTGKPPLMRSMSTGLLFTLLSSFLVLQGTTPANAVTLNDGSLACPIDLVTGTADSVTVTSYGIYCLVQFKGAETYTARVPDGISAFDYLVVGGGGGGASGGGGGGGVRGGSNYSVTPGETFTVTVGAGGTRGAGQTTGGDGGSSVFASITSLGGGGGGSGASAGRNGASGGGARYDCTTNNCRGLGTLGQGSNGGISTYPSYGAGGGGGGAGGTGFNTTRNYIGGNGGIGVTSNITGADIYYGGGGGGGINSNDNAYVGLNGASQLVYQYASNGGAAAAQTAGNAYTNGGGQGGLGGGGRGSSYGRSGGTQGLYANATQGTDNFGGGGGGTDPEDIYAGRGGNGTVFLRYVSNTNLKTITFNSNSDTIETSTQRVASGVSTTLNRNTFLNPGKIFTGWNTLSGGTGDPYSDQGSINTATDLTLYAQWSVGITHTVTFDANLGTGSMAVQVAGSSTPLRNNTFTRSSYTFAGWNTLANGTGFAYADAGAYPFAVDQTLYAQWTAVVTNYTVSFGGNAATGGTTPSQSASTSTPLTINGFTRTGYNFLGWNTNYGANTATYLDGQSYAFTADINLYAIWVLQAPNTVTFNGNTETGGSTDSQIASARTLLNSNGFTKTGYTFLRWNTRSDGAGVSYSSGYSYNFAASVTLYAIWGKNLTISYSGNTSTGGSAPVSQSYYVGGPNLELAGNTGALTKSGYILSGWTTQSDGGGTKYALGATNGVFSDDSVLYALWEAARYTILYVGNGNSTGSAPSQQTYASGDAALTLRSNSGTLGKKWSIFAGWNTNADGTGTTYTEGETGTVFSAQTILYAKWAKTSLYGIEDADITELQSWNASSNTNSGTVSNPANTSSVTVTVPGNALPVGTTVKLWELRTSDIARSKVNAAKDYIVNLVVSWLKSDNTIPNASIPISISIRNDSIKQGATAYQIIGDSVVEIGTAQSDGLLTISITQDPVITISNPVVQNNNGGGGGGGAVAETTSTIDTSTTTVEVVKPINQKVSIFNKKVFFGLGTSWLAPKEKSALATYLKEIVSKNQLVTVSVAGYTQPTLINPNPQKLSDDRAKAVVKALKELGVNAKITASGKGNAKTNKASSRYALLTITGTALK